MYKVYCDGSLIYDPRNPKLFMIDPVLELEDSCAGSFSFTLTPDHPFYGTIQRRSSTIDVYRDDEWMWSGFVNETQDDFWKRRTFLCLGELAYLADTIQPQAEYHDLTVREFFQRLLTYHNNQSDKTFVLGSVTVTDPNDSLYRYTNRETTLADIKDKLLDRLGGHIRIRHGPVARYIDYLSDYPRTSKQTIRFGKNLLSFAQNIDMSKIATAVIPLGAKLEESEIQALEARLTIKDVNDGKDYLESEEAVETYGWICHVVTWDDVTVAENLKTKGQAYLQDIQYEDMILTVGAVDLHNVDVDIDTIDLLDEVHVISEPHGLSRHFPVTKKTIPLDKPSAETLTLGTNVRTSMTDVSRSANAEIIKKIDLIPSAESILNEAKENASELIKTALNGFVVITDNADELLIMDTPDIKTAKKVWRWNLNGLGYSSTGYNGTYGLAITMDGSIVADFITTGTLNADLIKTGKLSLGGNNRASEIIAYDVNNTVFYSLTYNGLKLNPHPAPGYSGMVWIDMIARYYGWGIKVMSAEDGSGTALGLNPDKVLLKNNDTVLDSYSTPYMMSDVAFMAYNKLQINGTWSGLVPEKYVWIDLDQIRTTGNLIVSGTKLRVASTEDYGDRDLYCYETPSPMFGDVGEGVIAEDGLCYVQIDPVFLQTIDGGQYQVFLQAYGNGSLYVRERSNGFFVVAGDPGLPFGWEIKARQAGYESKRLEKEFGTINDTEVDFGVQAYDHITLIRKERQEA